MSVSGAVHWLWRAVDERGQTPDVCLQERRDAAAAASRFFRRMLSATHGTPPERITTDDLGSFAAAVARVPELQAAEHLRVRSAMRCDNRVEPAHQPTRLRERVIRGFKRAASAQRFLNAFMRVGHLFRPGRHLLSTHQYRATMRERVATWPAAAGLRAACHKRRFREAPSRPHAAPTALK